MNKHKWQFPSKGLRALFTGEIQGQLSDGAWENATPYNHWQFWCNLETAVGDKFEFHHGDIYWPAYKTMPVKRTAYNLTTLTDPSIVDLSERMRVLYIAAENDLSISTFDGDYFIRNDRVLTADEVRSGMDVTRGDYMRDKRNRYEDVGIELTCNTLKANWDKYTRKDLIKDLRLIKSEMKKIIAVFHG
jgi:hypothetical protein